MSGPYINTCNHHHKISSIILTMNNYYCYFYYCCCRWWYLLLGLLVLRPSTSSLLLKFAKFVAPWLVHDDVFCGSRADVFPRHIFVSWRCRAFLSTRDFNFDKVCCSLYLFLRCFKIALFVSMLFVFMLPLFWAKHKGFLALAVGNLTCSPS